MADFQLFYSCNRNSDTKFPVTTEKTLFPFISRLERLAFVTTYIGRVVMPPPPPPKTPLMHKENNPFRKMEGILNFKLYRVSQEECARLRESVPYVKVYRYNPKHLCPKLNDYGDNGQRKVGASCGSKYCNLHS